MAKTFRSWDVDQGWLLPPSVHEFVPPGHLAHFVRDTVREALDHYFAAHPRVRSYVLDEQGELRRHVVVFLDGEQIRDRACLGEPVADGSKIYVMQALSGG